MLLIAGVFAILHVRERRLWVRLADVRDADGQPTGATRTMLALSTARRTLDVDDEFQGIRNELYPDTGPHGPIGDMRT